MKENVPCLPLARTHGHTQEKIRKVEDRTPANFCTECGFWYYRLNGGNQ